MIERADRALLLCDSSKFDAAQFERIGPLEAWDDLVTDAAPGKRLAAALRGGGVTLHVARA
jgi:DeoR/GlpR family transcriptional regulator of sugar metabolism